MAFFSVPARGDAGLQEDLNVFLRSHRVLTVHREFVGQGENAFWALAVEYLDGPVLPGGAAARGGKERVDYKELLARRIKDADVLRLFAEIVGTYHTQPGRGLPIGNLVSQHLANFYLGHLDHWVKETLRVAGYVRYMDDFVLWGLDRAELTEHLAAVRGFLDAELGLALKENVQLNRSEGGVPFLGYRVFPERLTLGPRARRRFARKLRGYEREWTDGAWSEADLARHVEALLSYVRFADTTALRRQILRRYGTAA